MSNSPSPGSRRWLIVSSIGSSIDSCCPSDSSTQTSCSSGIRSQVAGLRSRACPCATCRSRDPRCGAPALTASSTAASSVFDVDVERHELVGDLRVRVLGRVAAQRGELLGQPAELARRAGDVADLDVVGVERRGGLEQLPAQPVGLGAGRLAADRRRSRPGTRPRGTAARRRRRSRASRAASASAVGARRRRATGRYPGNPPWRPPRSGPTSRTGSTRARSERRPDRTRSSTEPSARSRDGRYRRPRGAASHPVQAFLPISARAFQSA